jgi:hypothetical protein
MNKEPFRFDYEPFEQDVLLVGMGGSGKSYCLNKLFVNALPVPFVAWDSQWTLSNPEIETVHEVKDVPYGRSILQPYNKSSSTFDSLCEKIYSWQNIVLIVDEAHEHTGKFKFKSEYFGLIANAGRPKGISLVTATRRPQQLHNDLLSNVKHIFCFKIDIQGDIEYMEKWVGSIVERFLPDPRRRKSAWEKNEPTIPDYHAVYRGPRGNISIIKV